MDIESAYTIKTTESSPTAWGLINTGNPLKPKNFYPPNLPLNININHHSSGGPCMVTHVSWRISQWLVDLFPLGDHRVIIDSFEKREYDDFTYLDFPAGRVGRRGLWQRDKARSSLPRKWESHQPLQTRQANQSSMESMSLLDQKGFVSQVVYYFPGRFTKKFLNIFKWQSTLWKMRNNA